VEAAKESTKNDYLQRINRVIEHVNANPAARHTLCDLARIASFSEYHFHRVFHAMTGESLFQYVGKIRLAHAAHELLYRPDKSVSDIASSFGFSTLSDFARAFKKRYRASPIHYRRAKREHERPGPLSARELRAPARVLKKIRLLTLADMRVAYILSVGLSPRFRNSRITAAYARLHSWAKARGFLGEGTMILGMYPDNPVFTPLSECRYYSCLSIPEEASPDGEIGVMRLDSGGLYAACSFNPKAPLFAPRFFRTTSFLYGSWIPDRGYYPDDKPFLELYNVLNGKLVSMDFCIPVRTL
jgi:AraC family transcriptional regulator